MDSAYAAMKAFGCRNSHLGGNEMVEPSKGSDLLGVRTYNRNNRLEATKVKYITQSTSYT